MGSASVDRRQKPRPGPQSLAVIHWKHADGTEAESHPLSRAHAEALLHAFEAAYPRPRFWLETPVPLVPAAEV